MLGKCMWLKYRYIGFYSNIGLSKLYVRHQPTNISVLVNFSNLVEGPKIYSAVHVYQVM